MFIATKSDLDLVAQRTLLQPDAYCRSLGLVVPMSVSMKTGTSKDLFHMLVGVSMNPYVSPSLSCIGRLRFQALSNPKISTFLMFLQLLLLAFVLLP